MKKTLVIFTFFGSLLSAGNFASVIEMNERLGTIQSQIEEKISTLKSEISSFKKEQSTKLKAELVAEQRDYDAVVKNFNFFKLKHEKNVYAQSKIKENDEKMKEISKNHLDFKQRVSVKVERLSHKDFIPKEKKSTQEEIFFYEIKNEEFKEMFNVNKKRYDNTINLAIERFNSDSKTLIEEFKDLEYKRVK